MSPNSYVDIVKFAESFGATGFKVESADQLIPIIHAALEAKGPVLIEIPIDYSDNAELFSASQDDLGH